MRLRVSAAGMLTVLCHRVKMALAKKEEAVSSLRRRHEVGPRGAPLSLHIPPVVGPTPDPVVFSGRSKAG